MALAIRRQDLVSISSMDTFIHTTAIRWKTGTLITAITAVCDFITAIILVNTGTIITSELARPTRGFGFST
jgi:hypothetical protein